MTRLVEHRSRLRVNVSLLIIGDIRVASIGEVLRLRVVRADPRGAGSLDVGQANIEFLD
jgi:hypothetical protein